MELYVKICPGSSPCPEGMDGTHDIAAATVDSIAAAVMTNTTYIQHIDEAAAGSSNELSDNLSDVVSASANTVPCGVFFFVVYGPLFGTVCLLGLVGNSLSFAVLHKYSRNNVATYLLKALAVSDNIFLATASFVQMYTAMSMYFGLFEQLLPVYPYFQTYVWPFTHCVQMGTVYMMVLVAANRYIAVCKPLQAPHLCTKRNVQLQILVMTVLILIYNIPRFFEYRNETVNVTLADNSTKLEEVNKGLASYHFYNILYENVAYCIFVFLLPLMVLIFFNVHLVWDLKKAQRSRKAMTSRSSMEENNITLVMIIIIIVFIICQTPASINQILFYIIGTSPDGVCTDYQKYSDISNLLITMNSSMNFVIYCLFRRQFQQELIALMCQRRKGTQPLRRTIVLRAMHDSSFRKSGGYKSSASSRMTSSRTTTSSIMHSTLANMESVPLQQDNNDAPRTGSSSPGARSHDTTTSHISHYSNGREPMLAQS